MTERQRDNLVFGCIALVSLVFLAWVIPTYTPPYPGYGVASSLLPNVAFGLILALSMLSLGANLISHFKTKKTVSKEAVSNEGRAKRIPVGERVHLLRLALFMVPCLLLMPGMRLLGFIPGGLIFMLLIQFLCGQRKPLTMAVVACGSVGFMYAVMRYGLGVPMP